VEGGVTREEGTREAWAGEGEGAEGRRPRGHKRQRVVGGVYDWRAWDDVGEGREGVGKDGRWERAGEHVGGARQVRGGATREGGGAREVRREACVRAGREGIGMVCDWELGRMGSSCWDNGGEEAQGKATESKREEGHKEGVQGRGNERMRRRGGGGREEVLTKVQNKCVVP
jgi:hypothetical protein